jgi:hypothetical protein
VLNGRLVCGRTITASTWDGRTKFKKEETEAEKDRRDEAWQKFLGSEIEEESPSSSNKS